MSRTQSYTENNRSYIAVCALRKLLVALTTALVTAGFLFHLPTATAQKPRGARSQSELATLADEIESGRVQAVEIYYVPTYIVRSINLTPERLRKQYVYKISVPKFGISREAVLLAAALRRTHVTTTSASADLTWGIVLQTVAGESREVYLDGFGRNGQINGTSFAFQGDLYRWLQRFTASLE